MDLKNELIAIRKELDDIRTQAHALQAKVVRTT
jgi:hypothetical protein